MDSFGVFADGEWESFSNFFSNEEFDFTQLDDGLHFITSSTFCPNSEDNESLFYSSNLHNLFQDRTSFGSNCSTSVFNISTSPVTNDVSMYMVEEKISSHGPAFPDIAMEETYPINDQYMNGESQATTAAIPATELQLKRKFDEDDRVLLNVNSSQTNVKKKLRASRDVQGSKKKNVVQSKKNKNQNVSPKGNEGEESINGGSDGKSSTSSNNSEDDNASQETNNEDSKASLALNLNGKPRASRGSATDPQSLYARKRRERINERLKVLQNLVPNGTKVDISTMFEEAIHYVKFMQLQIKLLSSNDLWMYAPLAYNGVDLCLNQKISSFL